jgi:hypothetical protein
LQVIWVIAFALPALVGPICAGIFWAQGKRTARFKVAAAFEIVLFLYAALFAWLSESNILDALVAFSIIFGASNLTFLFGCLEARFRYGKANVQ